MFATGPNYTKLKTNLRLCINRLKLLEKKKTEMALKSRKEIADYIALGKPERAKIRVEHIIREDYLVEALEILEMFCDLLLARFGLIQQMKALDEGLAEAISSVLWVTPRLQSDIQELKIVSAQLTSKYGKPYAMACLDNNIGTVSEKLMHKLSVQAPPKLTVEKYLVEIAKYYNVDYEPDPQILGNDEVYAADALIDLAPAPPLDEKNDLSKPPPGDVPPPPAGACGGPGPSQGYQPFAYPQPGNGAPYNNPSPLYPGIAGSGMEKGAGGFALPLDEKKGGYPFDDVPPPAYFPPDVKVPKSPEVSAPGPSILKQQSIEDNNQEPSKNEDPNQQNANFDLPELPGVPSDSPLNAQTPDTEKKDLNDDIDFDDLTRRFEALKKKK